LFVSTRSGTAAQAPAGATVSFPAAIAEVKAGRYEGATRDLQQAVQAAPNDAAAHYYLGYAYYLMSQQAPADKELARKAAEEIALAYRLQPNFTPVSNTSKNP
jgi:Flp pilus assembly protein TadD